MIFFTTSLNPQTCGTITVGGSPCELTWSINATGTIGSKYNLGVDFLSQSASVPFNTTNYTTINIIASVLSITISTPLTDLWFSNPLSPGTTDNAATNNTLSYYNITCDYNPGNCNISIKGNDDLLSGPNLIGVSNLSWNQTQNSPSVSKILTKAYDAINETLGDDRTQIIYFWLDIPSAQVAGLYLSNFTIQGQAN